MTQLQESIALPVFDWQQAVSSSGGKPELAEELIVMFKEELPEFKAKIERAYGELNWASLHAALHKFLGGCNYCGVLKLKEVSAQFAKAAQHEDAATVANLMPIFLQELQAAEAALSAAGY